jgi:hypothetical protein
MNDKCKMSKDHKILWDAVIKGNTCFGFIDGKPVIFDPYKDSFWFEIIGRNFNAVVSSLEALKEYKSLEFIKLEPERKGAE